MSNAIFPALPGLAFGTIMAPTFNTSVQRSTSGKEQRAAFQAYPLWNLTLIYEFLRDAAAYAELQTLAGFFLARQGQFDSFLFTNPGDKSVTSMAFGTGDGSTTAFQLTRAYGGGGFTFVEPVMNLNGAPLIYVNGVLKTAGTDYNIGSTGICTFTSAPASAAALTWSGSFYYRCRFLLDSADFTQFMNGLWELKKLTMVGAPGNKL